MALKIDSFYADLQREITLVASEEGNERSVPEVFTEYMVEVLSEAGEIDGAEIATYQAVGARASGFALSEDETTLWLFLTDHRGSLEIENLGKVALESHFKRMLGFVEKASAGLWKSLEESSSAWDMAQRINFVWQHVSEVRLVVLTNTILKTQVPSLKKHDGRSVHPVVWDLTRLHNLSTSGRSQEPISVDVLELWGRPIPCIGPEGESGSYDAYLLMLPGEFIATIYEEHGPRLLELNVRSFLQARGKVNQGIQETIKNSPRRFLAYNNGLSMTASSVTITDLERGGTGLTRIDDLQIVNGGQTSASLHYAKSKNKTDLSEIFVQAKLSVVEPAQLADLVPQISKSANTQNKVNMADFSANDPFHVEVEKFSRTVWAPASSGTVEMTRWFYERARGQYADAHARERTPARQRQFKAVHPTSQKFTKTDLAKYENTWDQRPWVVSLGAEKNFRDFMIRLEERGRSFKPDQQYFENLISKAILFRKSERLIGSLNLGGYRAQTVTYTLARLLHDAGQRLDLKRIWRIQGLTEAMTEAIDDLAPRVHAELVSSAGNRNVSEWAKREDAWKSTLGVPWELPPALLPELDATSGRTKRTSTASIGESLGDDEAADLLKVMNVSGATWFEVSKWSKDVGVLQGWQRSIAFSVGKLLTAGKEPSRKQLAQAAKIIDEARRRGFAG